MISLHDEAGKAALRGLVENVIENNLPYVLLVREQDHATIATHDPEFVPQAAMNMMAMHMDRLMDAEETEPDHGG